MHILTWRHKPLCTLTLALTKSISNLEPKTLTLILLILISSNEGWSVALGLGLGFLDSSLCLTQYSVIIKELDQLAARISFLFQFAVRSNSVSGVKIITQTSWVNVTLRACNSVKHWYKKWGLNNLKWQMSSTTFSGTIVPSHMTTFKLVLSLLVRLIQRYSVTSRN